MFEAAQRINKRKKRKEKSVTSIINLRSVTYYGPKIWNAMVTEEKQVALFRHWNICKIEKERIFNTNQKI